MKRLIILTLVTLLLAACAPQWTYLRGYHSRHIASSRYDVILPARWVSLRTNDSLVVSCDGPQLQKIVLTVRPQVKAFPKIKQASRADMLPSDLSAHFIAELRAEDAHGLPSLKVEEEGPADLGGHPGFRVLVTYSTTDGVSYRLLAYGMADKKGYVQLIYNAPAIYDFDRSRSNLETVRASLKIH